MFLQNWNLERCFCKAERNKMVDEKLNNDQNIMKKLIQAWVSTRNTELGVVKAQKYI